MTPFTNYKAVLYGHWKNGFLLVDGGIGDQPDWYVRAMNRMSTKDNELQIAKLKKMKDESKRQIR